ncbi:hypothetical protein CLV90_3675 [Maribacter spongiicola]|uniref:Uncharacterized protein n=1 Tax=Maribacter spongiicola TaxID=1206753 RepID=A0A4R7JL09_9FLAO|nr:hypothetical protein [Maribacter spongiicola]TDT38701.1 hypothetical protein CLV90_3675 [Maribacter spongiicola]
MSLTHRISLAILACIILQSCSKETDLISEYVVLDADKPEYRSVKIYSDFEIEKSKKTVALIPFSD